MRKRTKITIAAAVATIATGGAWVGLGSASASSERSAQDFGWGQSSGSADEVIAEANRTSFETLVVRETNGRGRFIDVGRPGESPGDYFVFENKLKNRSGSEVGRDAGMCMLGIRTFKCEATALIPGRGKIEVSGVLFSNAEARLPITGGTQDFRGTGGQLMFAEDRNGDEVLVFELVD